MTHSFLTDIERFSAIELTSKIILWFGLVQFHLQYKNFYSFPLKILLYCCFAVFPNGLLLFVKYVCVFNNHPTYSALAEFHNSQICIVSLSKQLQ